MLENKSKLNITNNSKVISIGKFTTLNIGFIEPDIKNSINITSLKLFKNFFLITKLFINPTEI